MPDGRNPRDAAPGRDPQVITVMGTGRSGTSLITRMLNLLGVYLGPDDCFMAPTEANPKGYYELEPVFHLNNEILALQGGNCWEPPDLPSGWESAPRLAEQRRRAEKLMQVLFQGRSSWAWKDPRSCWTLPFWRQFLPPLQYIFALRNPLDVARSLGRADNLSFDRAITYWHGALVSALQHTRGQRRLFLFYDDIMGDWQGEFQRMARFIGQESLAQRDAVLDQARSFVEKKLHRNRTTLTEVLEHPDLPFAAKSLYMTLRAYVNQGGGADFVDDLDRFSRLSLQGHTPSAKVTKSEAASRLAGLNRKLQSCGSSEGNAAQSRERELRVDREPLSEAEREPRMDLASISEAEREPAVGQGPARPGVSIIIPVFNRVDFTRTSVDSLYRNTPTLYENEVIVVDNASTDGTAEFLRQAGQEHLNLSVWTHPTNLGFSAACNQGARLAGRQYLLFLNNDTEVIEGWLEPLVRVLDTDPAVAAVGGRMLQPDGSIQSGGVWIFDDQRLKDPLLPRPVFVGKPGDDVEANRARTCQALTAACMLVRKSAFEAVGGFDEAYWNGYEDVDLCFKLGQAGHTLVYQPESAILHFESQSGPERFSRAKQNIELLHHKWLDRIRPDMAIRPDGILVDLGAGKVQRYQPAADRHEGKGRVHEHSPA